MPILSIQLSTKKMYSVSRILIFWSLNFKFYSEKVLQSLVFSRYTEHNYFQQKRILWRVLKKNCTVLCEVTLCFQNFSRYLIMELHNTELPSNNAASSHISIQLKIRLVFKQYFPLTPVRQPLFYESNIFLTSSCDAHGLCCLIFK